MLDKTVFLTAYFILIDSTPAPTHLLVTRVGPCYDPQESIVKVSELTVTTTQTYDSKMSGFINISENISNGWKIKATMQKCVDMRNIDSCDFFKSFFLINNGCSQDEDENLYVTLFNFTNPKIICPVQAGRYELQNYPFYSEDNYVTVFESKISTSVFGYTFRLEGYSVDWKKLFCAETYLQLLHKRSHEWTNNANNRVTTSSPPTTIWNEDE